MSFNKSIALAYHYGPFKGMTVHTELEVMQSPAGGRKLPSHGSKVDARPIEPPPVIRVRYFEVKADGREAEIRDYARFGLDDGGAIVHAVLYRLNEPINPHPDGLQPIFIDSATRMAAYTSDECTTLTHGGLFQSALELEWRGETILVCPFGSLSVREEGNFVLCFRAFQLPTDGATGSPINSEAWSDSFEIFSSKSAKALSPSSELTNAIAGLTPQIHQRNGTRAMKRADFS
ncbi:hypothetical protein CYLTODRAFT_484657 [Cylindrobasidium torrendii FP15055 ss-10]|uniref:Velvet domain-containing protein n=1 Tax=Cylindrobasidium torrendii FP15055 ss-10 TaxID=1314674 RepID=A0A0D7BV10_9AGAR|nr:hypothetical protein CYLTODRAFT_484657 [Cylindrobasidium torrendii FP15055 ss-10]